MKLGIVGLGRMGAAMRERLRRGGHEVTGFDLNAEVSDVASVGELVAGLAAPRVVWLMAPAGEATEGLVAELGELLAAGDILVDGGNSLYKDSIRRGETLAERGIRFLDAGVSGGIWGLENGFCVMVGGERAAFEAVEPAIATLAPEDGYLHAGPSGAGHYVKMIHNGIEYGLMQAYAEGFDLLARTTKTSTSRRSPSCGNTAPWCARGCWSSPGGRSPKTPSWRTSSRTSRTPARAAGRPSRPSSGACRRA